MHRRSQIGLFLMTAAACCAASPSLAFEQVKPPTGIFVPMGGDTLVGVTEVSLIVNDTTVANLSSESLQASLELQLRKNGLPVKKLAKCLLVIDVDSLQDDVQPVSACTISVRLMQPVTFSNGDRSSAITWTKESLGIYGDRVIAECIKRKASEYVDIFSNDWLEANPQGKAAK